MNLMSFAEVNPVCEFFGCESVSVAYSVGSGFRLLWAISKQSKPTIGAALLGQKSHLSNYEAK